MTQGFIGKKCDLSFEQIVNKMIKHHREKLQKFGDSALVLCSLDRTEHGSDKTNIISLATHIYSYVMGKTITTTTTYNLYT